MTNQQNILARTSFSKIDFLITNSNIPIRKKMIRIQFTEKNFMVAGMGHETLKGGWAAHQSLFNASQPFQMVPSRKILSRTED